MKSIVVVSTQMQLLNSVEVLKHFDCKNNILIIDCDDKNRKKQICDILNLTSYGSLFKKQYLFIWKKSNKYFSKLYSLYQKTCLLLISLCYKKADFCIIGNDNNFHQHYLMFLLEQRNRKLKKVWTDDGNAIRLSSIKRIEKLKNNEVINDKRSFWDFYHIEKAKNYTPRNLLFFTIQDCTVLKEDEIILNRYLYLESHIKEFNQLFEIPDSEIIFLGQPLCKDNFVTPQSYNEYLRKFAEMFPNSKIIYYMHPEENEKRWLDEYSCSRFDIRKNNVAFEVIAMNLKPRSIIASFFTSSLVNLSKLNLDMQFYSLFLNEIKDVNNIYEQALIRDYEYFKTLGIKVLEF